MCISSIQTISGSFTRACSALGSVPGPGSKALKKARKMRSACRNKQDILYNDECYTGNNAGGFKRESLGCLTGIGLGGLSEEVTFELRPG